LYLPEGFIQAGQPCPVLYNQQGQSGGLAYCRVGAEYGCLGEPSYRFTGTLTPWSIKISQVKNPFGFINV
jgi:hypothetical protein